MDSIQLADKYGWPALGLFVIGLFFWKALWPLLVKRSEQAEEFLKQQVASERGRTDRLTAEFLTALERRDQIDREFLAEIKAGFAEVRERRSADRANDRKR